MKIKIGWEVDKIEFYTYESEQEAKVFFWMPELPESGLLSEKVKKYFSLLEQKINPVEWVGNRKKNGLGLNGIHKKYYETHFTQKKYHYYKGKVYETHSDELVGFVTNDKFVDLILEALNWEAGLVLLE
jgi:hypothetical protein